MTPLLLRPETGGLARMRRLRNDLFSPLLETIGFNPEKSWALLSLESYEGRMEDLISFAYELQEVVKAHKYDDRKTFTWTWPLPPISASEVSADTPGVLQLVHLPKGSVKPAELSCLEFIDIHSQLLGRIGFELLRLDEFLRMWELAAKDRMQIVTAGISRNVLEAVSSLYELAVRIAEQWTLCKTTSGEIWETSSGGHVDRDRARQAQTLREILRASRFELHLNDSRKDPDFSLRLTEWRNPALFPILEQRRIKFRTEVESKPPRTLVDLVRSLSKRSTINGSSTSLISDYELLCNVVHPSMGGFRLYSSPELSDSTQLFSYIEVGRTKGRSRYKDGEVSATEATPFGMFATSICTSAIASVQVYVDVLAWLVAIADDIALTTDVEKYTLHHSWQYPKTGISAGCLCGWGRLEACHHEWGNDGPAMPESFEVSVNPVGRVRRRA